MAHERQEIRDAVKAQLIGTGPSYRTAAGARVFGNRMTPINQVELPALVVYTEDETVAPSSLSTAPRELTRTLNLAIEGYLRVAPNVLLDDKFDDLALQIETAMDYDCEFGGKCFTAILSSTEFGIKTEGDRPMGAIRMVYSIVYHTDLRLSEETDIFETATVTYDLAGAQHPDDQAQDSIENINQDEDVPEEEP